MKIRAAFILILVIAISWIKMCSAANDKQNCSDISIDLAAIETYFDRETGTFKYLSENPDCPEREKEKGNICYCADIHWIYAMKQPWAAVCVEKVSIHFEIGKNSSEYEIDRLVKNNADMREPVKKVENSALGGEGGPHLVIFHTFLAAKAAQ